MTGSLHRPRGGLFWRWIFGRWMQMLAFGDLAGADGRPSRSTFGAASVLYTGLAAFLFTERAAWACVTLVAMGALWLIERRGKLLSGVVAALVAKWNGRLPGSQLSGD